MIDQVRDTGAEVGAGIIVIDHGRILFDGPLADLSVRIAPFKTIEIDRRSSEGLICKDNIRADIKVAFFVRVNKQVEDVLKVAQQLGCERASEQSALIELFDPALLLVATDDGTSDGSGLPTLNYTVASGASGQYGGAIGIE